jgi:UDP-N-acetylmuramate dehydrogenase
MIREEITLKEAAEQIRRICGAEAVLEEEAMSIHTTFRIGGPAAVFVIPPDEEKLRDVLILCRSKKLPCTVMGNGSNLLVSDEGYRGIVVQVSRNMNEIRTEGELIHAQAGAMLSAIARRAMEESLTGMEPESGIPGTLGGALSMNAGAYGGEMKDITLSVRVLTPEGEIRELDGEQMQFAYRTSIVQKENLVVLSAVLKLKKGDAEQIRARMEELRQKRTLKQPLDLPSAGSTFKRPQGYFAAALIDEAGLRGCRVGGAMVSEKHCGFLVNADHATAADVRALMEHVKTEVLSTSGVELEPEVRMLGFD